MITTKKGLIAGAALAGLLAGVGAPVQASNLLSGSTRMNASGAQDTGKTATKDKKDKHDCKGKNSCKGKGGCGSSKGKNDCKGKGECRTDGKPMKPSS